MVLWKYTSFSTGLLSFQRRLHCTGSHGLFFPQTSAYTSSAGNVLLVLVFHFEYFYLSRPLHLLYSSLFGNVHCLTILYPEPGGFYHEAANYLPFRSVYSGKR